MGHLIYQSFTPLNGKPPIQPLIPIEEYGGDIESIDDLYADMVLASSESFRTYADWIDCDYELDHGQPTFIKDHYSHSSSVMFEWVKIIYDPKYDKYDKIAVFDVDVIANTTEDIFEQSDAEVYGVAESEWKNRDDDKIYLPFGCPWDLDPDVLSGYQNKYKKHNMVMKPASTGEHGCTQDSGRFHFQGGMIVMTKEARHKARKLFVPWYEWFYDEDPMPTRVSSINYDDTWISANVTVNDFEYESLDQSWMNSPCQFQLKHMRHEASKIKFNHYVGSGEKRMMLTHCHQGWYPMVRRFTGTNKQLEIVENWGQKEIVYSNKKATPENML
jgi:hypothetical protein